MKEKKKGSSWRNTLENARARQHSRATYRCRFTTASVSLPSAELRLFDSDGSILKIGGLPCSPLPQNRCRGLN